MARAMMLTKKSRAWGLIAAGVALAGLGCTSGVTHDDGTAALLSKCGKSVKGSRYEVCGHWTTSSFAAIGGPGVSVIGAVDSAPQPQGTKYQVGGGTFHGAR